jgi:diguanylate cyclase (GGDEF)-like protein
MVGVGSAARITLVAGGLLTAVAFALGVSGTLVGHDATIDILPQGLGALLVVLAWRFRRHRLAVAAILLAAVDAVAGRTDAPGDQLLPAVVAMAAGLDLALLSILRNQALWRPGTALWIAVVVLQMWAAVVGPNHLEAAPVRAWLEHPLVPLGTLLAAGLVVLVAAAVRRGAFEAGLLWSAIALGLVLTGGGGSHETALLLTAAQLALLVSVTEDSYRLAYHDELTGLPGRRAFIEAVATLSEPFTIAMADVDHFKRFNDRHGHDAGDQVLRMVADELVRVGGGGRAYRWGGEEFAIVFPGRKLAEVREELEEVRRAIEGRRFALRGPGRPRSRPEQPRKSTKPTRRVTVTVSIGAADAGSRRPTAEAVLRAADKALYRAKRAGRNRVVAAGDRL